MDDLLVLLGAAGEAVREGRGLPEDNIVSLLVVGEEKSAGQGDLEDQNQDQDQDDRDLN